VNLAFVDENAVYGIDSLPADRTRFDTYVHETMHVLGISGASMIQRWINPVTHAPYYQNGAAPFYSFVHPQYPGKTFLILNTPKISAFLTERWGVNCFFGNPAWPMGAEWEDSGGSGTAGAHLEDRVFFTEVMGPVNYGIRSHSDVTLTLLEDTGWYDVNYTKAEFYGWGNWRSIGGATRQQFSMFPYGEPQLHWPAHYLMRTYSEMNLDEGVCAPDLRATGRAAVLATRNCGTRTDNECAYPGFYDALDTRRYGSSPSLDYLLIPRPNTQCQVTRNADPTHGKEYGASSWCMMSTLMSGPNAEYRPFATCMHARCDTSGNVFVTVGGVEKACPTGGSQTWSGYAGAVSCPNSSVLCQMVPQRTQTPRVSQSATVRETASGTRRASPSATPRVTPGASAIKTPKATAAKTPVASRPATSKASEQATSKGTATKTPGATERATASAFGAETPQATWAGSPFGSPTGTLRATNGEIPSAGETPWGFVEASPSFPEGEVAAPSPSPMLATLEVSTHYSSTLNAGSIRGDGLWLWVGIGLGVLGLVAAVALCVSCFCRVRAANKIESEEDGDSSRRFASRPEQAARSGAGAPVPPRPKARDYAKKGAKTASVRKHSRRHGTHRQVMACEPVNRRTRT
jgi:hypothetical protein